jgi:growth factor receptor-binding protein 2
MEAEAKHDFVPGDPETELAFKKGEKLLILNYGDPVQWYNAQKNGQTGLVPGNYIEVRKAGWYLGRIPRLTAENMLINSAQDGAFLVRLSESSPNDFSLSVKCGDVVQHFRILKSKDHKYFLWTVKFDSLNELVENYKLESVSRTQQIFLRDMDCNDETFIVEAIYDFEPKDDAEDGETELGFKKGDLIQVFDCRDDNWWGGRIGDRTGFFPKLYVRKQDLSPFKG